MLYIGEKKENITYKERKCAYAILQGKEDKVGLIEVRDEYFLIGGGIENNEDEIEALKRETIEEAGYSIKEIKKFEEVEAYYLDKERGYLKVVATIYIAELDEYIKNPIELDHKLIWISLKERKKEMFRKYQEAVVQEYQRTLTK